jgi:tol-pal system protein YbgF
MKKSTLLLLFSTLGLVLMAPPAYPQKTQDQLNQLMADSIALRSTVKQLQDSFDQKNAETNKLLQEILTRFTALDTSVKTLNESLTTVSTSLKTTDEKSARDLEITKTSIEGLRKTVDEGMVGLQRQMTGLSGSLNQMKTAEQPLPTATQLFQQAQGELNAGFYSLAVDDFREFLKNYPNDPLRSPVAQFYIGDALMAQKKFKEAADEFDLVLTKYPSSDKKCSALYQKGRAFIELKQIPQAQAVLTTVGKDCAGTQEAANAAADLKTLPKPQRGN